MKVATYLAIAGVIAIVFGLEFLLIPELGIKQYGVPTEPHNLMQARYFGSTLLAFGLIPWLPRRTQDDVALRAILRGAVVGNLVGLLISAWAAITGLQNALAWLSVATYGVLLFGAMYFLSTPARRTSLVAR